MNWDYNPPAKRVAQVGDVRIRRVTPWVFPRLAIDVKKMYLWEPLYCVDRLWKLHHHVLWTHEQYFVNLDRAKEYAARKLAHSSNFYPARLHIEVDDE